LIFICRNVYASPGDHLWIPDGQGKVWDQVGDRDRSDPVLFHLETGCHVLVFKQQENDTKIDKILIINDLNFTLEGIGP